MTSPAISSSRATTPAFAVFALLLAVILGGCGWLEVHRIPIQQGNVVTQEMIDQLEPGMTRSQVAYVLGEPVMSGTFDENRWDYVYSLYDRERELHTRRVSLFFQNDRLSHFAGDLAPGAQAAGDPIEMPELGELETDMPPAGPDPETRPQPPPQGGPAPQPGPVTAP